MLFEKIGHTIAASIPASIDGLIQEQRLANVLNLRYSTFQVESLGEHNFEDLLDVDAVTRAAEYETCPHGLCKSPSLNRRQKVSVSDMRTSWECRKHARTYLVADLLLIFPRKVHKVVVLGTNQERNGSFVEASTLSVPLFDTVERRLPGEIEHKEDSHGVVADERKHIDELSLSAKIPDGEGDFGVAY